MKEAVPEASKISTENPELVEYIVSERDNTTQNESAIIVISGNIDFKKVLVAAWYLVNYSLSLFSWSVK